ncbi:hypothetical protein IG631_15253 [Alternaria alternata]|nr:hypothetical protein IG631_15253 [Alternaria alternata]
MRSYWMSLVLPYATVFEVASFKLLLMPRTGSCSVLRSGLSRSGSKTQIDEALRPRLLLYDIQQTLYSMAPAKIHLPHLWA